MGAVGPTAKRQASQAPGIEMAEREGFEPSRGLHPWRFSRPLPSTARPPLREENRVVRTYLGAGLSSNSAVYPANPADRPETLKDLWRPNSRQRGEAPVLVSVWRATASRSSGTGSCASCETHRRCLHGDTVSTLLRATGRTPRRAGHCRRPGRCNGMDHRLDGERLEDRVS